MIIRDFGECTEVVSSQYALSLYTLAESIKAKSILEVGMGWGWSSRAFALSLENRSPSKLTSIDKSPDRIRRENRKAVLDAKIDWEIIAGDSAEVDIEDEFDLIYIDANPDMAHADFLRFYPKLSPGGMIVIDGYGGQVGPTEAVDNLSGQYPFFPLPYKDVYAHAVHRKPELPRSGKGIRIVCEQCSVSINCVSWREADTKAFAHTKEMRHNVHVEIESRGLNYIVIPKGAA